MTYTTHYKFLVVIHLQEIEKRESITGVSNWMNVTFIDSDKPLNSDHFAFKFKTKTLKDIDLKWKNGAYRVYRR